MKDNLRGIIVQEKKQRGRKKQIVMLLKNLQKHQRQCDERKKKLLEGEKDLV